MLCAVTAIKPPPPPQSTDDGAEADTAWDFPSKSVVKAVEVEPLFPAGPCSVFDLAGMAARLKKHGRFGDAAGFIASAPAPTVQREAGVVRVVGAAYPSNRWTDEREEQERARRARQKPPKPTKKAKTRGKKVRQWDGEEIDG